MSDLSIRRVLAGVGGVAATVAVAVSALALSDPASTVEPASSSRAATDTASTSGASPAHSTSLDEAGPAPTTTTVATPSGTTTTADDEALAVPAAPSSAAASVPSSSPQPRSIVPAAAPAPGPAQPVVEAPAPAPVPAPAPAPAAGCTTGGAGADATALAERFCAHRDAHGKPGMTRSAKLDSAAAAWAQHLVDSGAGLEHNPQYDSIGWAACPGCTAVGENVGFQSSPNVDGAWQTWLDSPMHRDNIDTPAPGVYGIGSATGADGTTYYVHMFAWS